MPKNEIAQFYPAKHSLRIVLTNPIPNIHKLDIRRDYENGPELFYLEIKVKGREPEEVFCKERASISELRSIGFNLGFMWNFLSLDGREIMMIDTVNDSYSGKGYYHFSKRKGKIRASDHPSFYIDDLSEISSKYVAGISTAKKIPNALVVFVRQKEMRDDQGLESIPIQFRKGERNSQAFLEIWSGAKKIAVLYIGYQFAGMQLSGVYHRASYREDMYLLMFSVGFL